MIYIGSKNTMVNWGGQDDPRDYLTVGQSYHVEQFGVMAYGLLFILKEFPNRKFSSGCFKKESSAVSIDEMRAWYGLSAQFDKSE